MRAAHALVIAAGKMSFFSAEFRRETLPWFVAIACIAFAFAVSAIFFWCLDAAPVDLRPQRCGAAVGAQQGREDQYYTNYMNLLQNLGSGDTSRSLANLEMGHAGTSGTERIAAASDANKYNLMGQQASNAATADIAGAVGGLLENQKFQDFIRR